jgi:preprotein translocase subunit SecA
VITKDRQIKIIDENTGETMHNMRWKNGLHYFLELKHSIFPSQLHCSGFFENHHVHFARYKSNIIGLTGTLGSVSCQKFLERNYGVNCFKIPTFKPKRFTKENSVLCKNEEDWFNYLVQKTKDINSIKNKKRKILILFKTIKNAMYFCGRLEHSNIEFIEYIRSDIQDFEKVAKELETKQIIVATNLAGRGTDIRISEEIAQNGGLHVIMTFLAPNIRIEDQAFGRTARKGQMGSGGLIVNLESEPHVQVKFEDLRNKYPNVRPIKSVLFR